MNLALALWRLQILLLALVVVIIFIGFVARAFRNTVIILNQCNSVSNEAACWSIW